jgi:hypothetical protein
MSRLTTGISGAIALVLISGAAQFALGRDLGQTSLSPGAPITDAGAVNRGAKADRATGPAGAPALTRTVSLKLNGFSETTFLLRVPVAADSPAASSSAVKRIEPKPAVACEPMVSVLTEVAKQLQPGRCVT